MDRYAIVKDGAIVKTINKLPKSFTFPSGETTGDFHKMPSSVLVENGYYKIRNINANVDHRYQVSKPSDYKIEGNEVTREFKAVDINIMQMKRRLIDKLETLAEYQLKGVIEYNNNSYQLTDIFIDLLDSMSTHLINGGMLPTDFLLFNVSNEGVSFTKNQFLELHLEYASYSYSIYRNMNQHKLSIGKLKTSKKVADYDYKTGW